MRPYVVAVFCASLASVPPVSAREFRLSEGNAQRFSIQIPENWTVTTTDVGIEAASPEKDSFIFAKVLTQSKDDPNKWISLATGKLQDHGISFKKSDVTAKLETPVFARGESPQVGGFPSVPGASAAAKPDAAPPVPPVATVAPPPVVASPSVPSAATPADVSTPPAAVQAASVPTLAVPRAVVQPDAAAPKSVAPPPADAVSAVAPGPTSSVTPVVSEPVVPAPVVPVATPAQITATAPVALPSPPIAPPNVEEAKSVPAPKPPEEGKSAAATEKPPLDISPVAPTKTAEAAPPTDQPEPASVAPKPLINATIPSMALNAEVQAPRLPRRVLSYKDTSVQGWPVDVQLVTFPAPNHAALFLLQESGPADMRAIAIMESVKTVN